MKKTETLLVDNIGPVVVTFRKVKHVRFSLVPFKGLQVTAPSSIKRSTLLEIIQEKKQWVQKHKKSLSEMEDQFQTFTQTTPFRTRRHQLSILFAVSKKPIFKIQDGLIEVILPKSDQKELSVHQSFIRKAIDEALRVEAKEYLIDQVAKIAKEKRFKYKKVFLKNLKSRWGSCSHVNNINLNIQLMRFSDSVIDYVIIHELCHTIEKNHSVAFWKLVEKHSPNYKKYQSQLKNQSCRYY